MREKRLTKKILGFGIVIVLVAVVFAVMPVPVSAAGGAEPSSTWIVEPGFRLDGGWPHCPDIVKLPDGTYRMYHADASPSGSYPVIIRSAVSSDGLIWTRESGIRIGLGFGGQETWTNTPDTIILPDGTYRMYYSHERYPFVGPLWGHILSAVSTDGITWSKEAGIRVDYGGTYDPVMATSPNIIELPDGTYRMYYSGRNEYANHRILSAISSDGLTWIKEPGVRVDIGGAYDSYRTDHPKVIQVPDGRYIMFYAGFDNVWSGRILSAVSTDGLVWTKESGIRISPEGLEGGPYSYVSPGDIIKFSNNQYRMYFSADREPWVSGDRLRILSAVGTIPPIPIPVTIDIKPGSYPNSINLGSMGNIPVAVITTENFNANDIDPETVVFAGSDPLKWSIEDVDEDGDMDMMFHFKTQDLELTEASNEATISGKTKNGSDFEGKDTVNIKP